MPSRWHSTHSHINAFVIVGGDSDFITLVEKLKQYDRKVFVVGGRSFTSQVMQKNCTEFVAYEDICGATGRGRQAGGRARALTDIAAAMPLIRRAIQLLADREMTPQLGLLKSTLLQLDSSFSERAYGANSFRDFVEKLAKAGHVALKGADRSFYVELREAGDTAIAAPAGSAGKGPTEPRAQREPRVAREGRARAQGPDAPHGLPAGDLTSGPVEAPADAPMPARLGNDTHRRRASCDRAGRWISHHGPGALAHRCEPTFPDVRAAVQTLHEDVRRDLR